MGDGVGGCLGWRRIIRVSDLKTAEGDLFTSHSTTRPLDHSTDATDPYMDGAIPTPAEI